MFTQVLFDFSTDGSPTVITGQRYGLTNLVDLAGQNTDKIGVQNPTRRYVNSKYPFQVHLIGRNESSEVGVTQTLAWDLMPSWAVKNDIVFLEQSDWMGDIDLLLFYRLTEYETRLESFLKIRLQENENRFVLLDWVAFPLNWAQYTGWGSPQVNTATVDSFASKFNPAYSGLSEEAKTAFVENTVIPAFNLLVELIITTAIQKAKEDAPNCSIGFVGFPTGIQQNRINRSFGYDFPDQSYDPRKANTTFQNIIRDPRVDYGSVTRPTQSVIDQLDFYVVDAITSHFFFADDDQTPFVLSQGEPDFADDDAFGGGSDPVFDNNDTISQVDRTQNRFSQSDYQIYLTSNIAEAIRLRELSSTRKPIFLVASDVIRIQFQRSLPNFVSPTANPYGCHFTLPFGTWQVDDLKGFSFDNDSLMVRDMVKAANRNGLDGIMFMLRGSDDPQNGASWSYESSTNYFRTTYVPIIESELIGEKYMLTDTQRPSISLVDNSMRGSLVITWNHIPGAERYYLIRAKDQRNSAYKVLTVTQKNFATDEDIQDNIDGSDYYYKVMAVVDNQFTPFSNAEKVDAGFSLPIGNTAKIKSPPRTGDLAAGTEIRSAVMQRGIESERRPVREANIIS